LTQSGHGCGPARVRRTAQFSIQKCDNLLIPDLVLGAGEAMRRREFIRLFSSTVVAWPVGARAQQPGKLPTIGFLGSDASAWSPYTAAFVQRLRELGWIEGRTIAIEYRWSEGRSARNAEIATEFVRMKVDVIVTNAFAASTVKQATSIIPIVFPLGIDPVGSDLIRSLAQPGATSLE
jgi:putative ABC transport system substrate-binding protein